MPYSQGVPRPCKASFRCSDKIFSNMQTCQSWQTELHWGRVMRCTLSWFFLQKYEIPWCANVDSIRPLSVVQTENSPSCRLVKADNCLSGSFSTRCKLWSQFLFVTFSSETKCQSVALWQKHPGNQHQRHRKQAGWVFLVWRRFHVFSTLRKTGLDDILCVNGMRTSKNHFKFSCGKDGQGLSISREN